MKIKGYQDFLLPIFESEVVFSDKFKNIIKKIDSPVAKAILDMESQDLDIANNYIDIGDNKNQITFITDRKAKEILSSPESKMVKHLGSGHLTHSDANAEIFSQLDYTPEGPTTYHPQPDELGEIMSEVAAPSGRVYCKVKFPGGISIINKERLQKSDVTKLPFKKSRQPGRVGATIQGLLRSANQSFSNAEIEVFVNKYKSEFDRFNDLFRNFELVSGKDIHYWYQYQNYLHGKSKGQLSNSCMAAASDRWLQIYTHNPDVCKLLILKADEDESKIKGRALVWKLSEPSGITYVDRIYTHDDSDIELFKQYVAQQGWYLKKRYTSSSDDCTMIAPDGTETRPRELSVQVDPLEYGGYPYLDTLKFYSPSSGKLSTDFSGEYQLEDTGGGYSNQECDTCNGYGNVECGDCSGSGRLRCEECNRGKIECPDCSGTGSTSCSGCNGRGDFECSTCDGSGRDASGESCSDCDGSGRIKCDDCDDDGRVECEECSGDGERECPHCDGHGWTQCGNCDGDGNVPCYDCGY
jgi:hypothetical protein